MSARAALRCEHVVVELTSRGVTYALLQGVNGDVITEVVLQCQVSSSRGRSKVACPLNLLPCLLGLTVCRRLLGLLCLIS